ncbi:hypothetical protein MtrunA17_Chr3g0112921 [Medicago truncatula]|uniref:Uncharacterized protein n=2 Tax=Medicago truncatula TaxID=3880 RepID=A0A396IZF9_MEDTR|nr:hypothetical protein MtrunA17_Chr3g0112921 [Medicago truncatula]
MQYHKVFHADTMDHFIPIVMGNFKSKIISKIIVSRLAKVMPEITSKEQIGFSRKKYQKLCLYGFLDQKSFGGIICISEF